MKLMILKEELDKDVGGYEYKEKDNDTDDEGI